ncbi:hypothetical protein F5Y18DRAFT_406994 [Xylariaceae sp. FL1019]|nr:hypothetical protein F5Y18DRAFT_406994 [Xylariaceae sp. FL1019]
MSADSDSFIPNTPHDDGNSVATDWSAAAWTRETTPTLPRQPPKPKDTEWYNPDNIKPEGFNSVPSSPCSSADTVTETAGRVQSASIARNPLSLTANQSVAASNLTNNAFISGLGQPVWPAKAKPVQRTTRPYSSHTTPDTANRESQKPISRKKTMFHDGNGPGDVGNTSLLKKTTSANTLDSDETSRDFSVQPPGDMPPFDSPRVSEVSGQSDQDIIMHDQTFSTNNFRNSHFNRADYQNPEFVPQMYKQNKEDCFLKTPPLFRERGQNSEFQSHEQREDYHMSGGSSYGITEPRSNPSPLPLPFHDRGRGKTDISALGLSTGPPYRSEMDDLATNNECQRVEETANPHIANVDMSSPGSEWEEWETTHPIEGIVPNKQGFKQYILHQIPSFPDQNKYLIDHIAQHMFSQYNRLVLYRLRGTQTKRDPFNASRLYDKPIDSVYQIPAKEIRDTIAVAGHGNGKIRTLDFGSAIYPPDIPAPPVTNFPAVFECPICFKDCTILKPFDWIQHVYGDLQPFTCTWYRCNKIKTFKRKSDWVYHEDRTHRHLESWLCDIDHCGYDSRNQTDFISHLVREHNFNEPLRRRTATLNTSRHPTWQKVEKCRTGRSREPHEEPCKFCGKTFPSWKKLTDHVAEHMEALLLPILRLIDRVGDLRNESAQIQSPNSLDDPASVIGFVPTDSGYASLGQGLSGVTRAAHHGTATDSDDAATEYTDASSVATWRKENYVSGFADDLFAKIQETKPDKHELDRISELLPDLLKTFALRLGYNAPTKMHSEVMYFTHKYRTVITDAFKKKRQEEENLEERNDRTISHDEKMPLDELVSSWLQRQDVGETHDSRSHPEQHDIDLDSQHSSNNEQENEENMAVSMGYRDFVLETESFRWLLGRLQSELRLSSTEPKSMETIRREIVASLETTQIISRKKQLKAHRASFDIEWDLLGFLEQQQYECEPSEAFPKVITITGSSRDAQALTCTEYLKQTWPHTGDVTVQLIRRQLSRKNGNPQSASFPDGTQISARFKETRFVLEAFGNPFSIAEIGEQLAWLATAFRPSPSESELVCCTPFISSLQKLSKPTHQPGSLSSSAIWCTFGFKTDQSDLSHHDLGGQCWHNLFLNPIVVKGYPVRSRAESGTGLEIPLNMMAGLARAENVSTFGQKTLIKGFSTLLIPIKRNGDTLVWHLVYHHDGSRISYLDGVHTSAQSVSSLHLASLRHVLGWCSDAEFYAGTARANNSVGGSGLPKPNQDAALGGVFVSPGKCIMGGSAFVLGIKDTPPHIARNSYISKLRWMDAETVLMWDESDKRGWLINGSSALLHIVRASLAYNSTDKFKSAFIFRPEAITEPQEPYKPDSAINVLLNRNNWALKLYDEDDEETSFKGRISQVYDILEKLIDYQHYITGEDGKKLAAMPRQHLEGWDFRDVVTLRDPIHPRVATLKSRGKGWVDVARTLHTVTLFGRGFGELIRPVGVACEYWGSLPKQKYYVAASLPDIRQIVSKNDFYDDGHTRLSDTIIWHVPTALFTTCGCQGAPGPNHCEPVQTLLPSSMLNLFPVEDGDIPEDGSGAVIFGVHSDWPWCWGDYGPPVEGDRSSSPQASEVDSFHDSGLGSSARAPDRPDTRTSKSSAPYFHRSSTDYGKPASNPEHTTCAEIETHESGEYTVGILCALTKELKAVRTLFDKKHARLAISGDVNHYALGEISKHMVVAASLPEGDYGTNRAANTASNMKRSFQNIKFCLLVGIGGGVPSHAHDIRLGDVVVSIPTGTHPGVFQYDRGKENGMESGERTGSLDQPPPQLLTAISLLESNPERPSNPLQHYIMQIQQCLKSPMYWHPGQDHDTFSPNKCSISGCRAKCAERNAFLRMRQRRSTDEPQVFYGLIASGNLVFKDAHKRNELAERYDVLCFEMEAAGIMNILPSLVIRGICDYADSSKNKLWQGYAAATAAAYAKMLLDGVTQCESQHHPLPKRAKSHSSATGWDTSWKRQRV